MIKALHSADFHFSRDNQIPALSSLETFAETGEVQDVALYVIAGDLFDRAIQNTASSGLPELQRVIQRMMNQAPVVAVTGTPTHDIEGGLYGTALGRTLYSKQPLPAGHYCHLDTINRARKAGGLVQLVETEQIDSGIMPALIRRKIPYVLAGSIRDDGPLPEVVTDVCMAQDAMRALTDRATTVIAMATQLHTIATGNMVPSYRLMADGRVRPVYF